MKLFYYLGCAILCISMFSCDDEMPTPPEEEELITTLIYELTATDQPTVTMRFEDLDGDGGVEPTVTGGTIKAGVTYEGAITLLNESESPSENITLEVQEEDDEHQFFFTNTFDGVVNYADTDDNDKPVGLVTTLLAADTGTGDLTITLVHEPVKDATNVEQGDITNADGSIDIEVTFSVTVE